MKKILLLLLSTISSYLISATEPSNPPKNSQISNITCTSVKINCDGTGAQAYLYVMRESVNSNSVPVDGTTYTVTTNVFGSNQNLGNNNWTVGVGTFVPAAVTVTNLKPNTKYYVMYYAVNVFPNPIDYLTSSYLIDSFTTKYSNIKVTVLDSCENTNSVKFQLQTNTGNSFTIFYGDGSSNNYSNNTTITHKFTKWGKFTPISSTGFGCTSTFDKSPITIIPSPKAIISTLTNDSQCLSNNLFKFDNTSTFGLMPSCALTQTWYFSTTDTLTTPKASFSYPTIGRYKVGLKSVIFYNNKNTGCWDTTSTFVVVTPPIKFSLGNDTTLCNNSTLSLTINNFSKILWFDSVTLNKHIFSTKGTYWAEIDSSGCVFRDTINIQTLNTPSLPSLFDSTVCFGDSIYLTVPSSPDYTLNWSNGSKSNSIKVKSAGLYKVTASNFCGIDTKTSDITFKDCSPKPIYTEFYIPDAFTPNGDGKNDFFSYVGDSVEINDTKIFNRWGEQIFQSSGKVFWDGYYQNKLCPNGVYVYQIKYTNNSTNTKDKKICFVSGTIMLWSSNKN